MDAAFYEKLRDFLNQEDHFAQENNMRITTIREGYAEGEFTADTRHKNGLDVLQGGATFTFGDFTFAGAVNSYGVKAIGMNAEISYIRPGTGNVFHAVAEAVSHGKKTGVFTVKVFDSRDRLIAHMTITGFFLDQSVF